jgi:hypothetical protein
MSKCNYPSCKKQPSFNINGGKAIVCADHKTENMINVKNDICEFESCNKHAMYGHPGQKIQFCKDHRLATMHDLRHKSCQFVGCTTRPSCNLIGQPPIFCSKHKSENMVNVVSKRCLYDGCTSVNPVFDHKGGKGRFCGLHKELGMIDVKHKLCEHDQCMTQSSYDVKGGKGRFCSKHKFAGMIDIKNIYCEYLSCDIVNPIYNKKGSKKGRFCVKHKEPGMVDVKHKLCEHDDCTTRPTYDYKDGKGRFCKGHKLDHMIDITHKYCEHDECFIRANYDIKGGNGRFCSKHKLTDMIDIANSYCIVNGCSVRARYGKPGQFVSHCTLHREISMIKQSNAKCSECDEYAIWGEHYIPLHCDQHKLENEQNLVEHNCVSCGLLNVLDKDNKCEHCNPLSWKKIKLIKQNALMSYLDSVQLYGNSTDKIIDSGTCGLERPDRVFDFNDKIIILECDEHQHQERICVCEQTRMVNIGQSFGGLPVYFIRFNPDHYTPHHKKISEESITKRHQVCAEFIKNIKDNRILLPSALVSVIYMYFNGWSSLNEESWNIITQLDTTS